MPRAEARDARSIDVVIPTWNRLDLLRLCLDSLAVQTREHRVIVVDNGSTDGTVEELAGRYPHVTCVALPENAGFGRAVNQGVAAGNGDIVILVNNDIVAETEFLARLVAPLETEQPADSAAGVMLDRAGVCIDSAGVIVDPTLAGYSYLSGQAPSATEHVAEPLGPCGGAAAYSRAAYEQLGGFDPEIFAYSEDIDLALRARAAGMTCVLVGDARVRHAGSATLGRRSAAQLRMAGWARGYLLGRYRLPWWALGIELGVALVDCVRRRSLLPLTTRLAGLRRGRQLPARPRVRSDAALGVLGGLKLRASA